MKKLFLLIICAALLSGCGQKSGGQLDAADEKDARISKGLELVQQKNWDEAIQQFNAALAKKSELGRPELELALIYHQQKKNYVRAVYHYERYLEKRPETEKRPLIQAWIQQAKVSLAGEVGPSDSQISEELVRLTRENNLLRKQLDAAGGAGAAAVPNGKTILTEPLSARPAPVAAQPVTAPKPERTYQVRTGDTLSRISGMFYGDVNKWRIIYEANRAAMKSETDIKVGQTIIIPTIEK
jgi:nucleoid-associated protein YgaU